MSRIEIFPPIELDRLLPQAVRHLSLARAHMVIDQLQALVRDGRQQELICLSVVSSDFSRPDQTLGIAVAHHRRQSDAATLLIAGALDDIKAEQQIANATDLAKVLDEILYDRGARFLQHASDALGTAANDPHSDQHASKDSSSMSASNGLLEIHPWPMGLGLEHVGTLEYQSGPTDMIERSAPTALNHADNATSIRLAPIDWTLPDQSLSELAKIVESTYVQTLDCPRLAEFRTALQTLRGYREADAFAPDQWFTVRACDNFSNELSEPAGCLILGRHDAKPDTTTGSSGSRVIELVYMGLVPSVRGKGLGMQLIREAAKVAQQCGAYRMILAVDEANHPARDLYRRVGFQSVMRESVWCKSLGSPRLKKLLNPAN